MKNHYEHLTDKITNREQLLQKLDTWRKAGRKVVFTNGCFDIVHRGHVEYLAKAASFGDIMVIGLNTDDSVSRLKGPNRPVQDQQARAIVLASMGFVDAVVYFNDDTPYELIKTVQPDYLVKGADYNPEDIVGYDIVVAKGGAVKTIELVQGYSTSAIIQKANS